MIKELSYKYSSSFIIVASALIFLTLIYQFSWKNENWEYGVLGSDGRGYYAYLPSIILFSDFTFEESQKREIANFPAWENSQKYLLETEGKQVNKYFPGLAILQVPFFLLACLFALIFQFPIDGYSSPFMLMFQIGNLFYALFGAYLFYKILLNSKIDKKLALLFFILSLFGTQIFHHVTQKYSLTHVCSFAILNLMIYAFIRSIKEYKLKHMVLFSISYALLILIRPTNAMAFILLPIFSNDILRDIKLTLSQLNIKKVGVILLTFLLTLIILPLLLYLQTGHPFTWPYVGKGFYFGSPKLLDVWFNYRAGLFIWTPVLFGMFLSLIVIFRKNYKRGIYVLIAFGVISYVISCWWNWCYGGGYGHRAFVEYTILFLFPTALALNQLKREIKLKAIYTGFWILTGLNIFQSTQVHQRIINPEYMNKDMYWAVFLKSGDQYKDLCKGNVDIRPYGITAWAEQVDQTNKDDIVKMKDKEWLGFKKDTTKLPDISNTAIYFEFEADKFRKTCSTPFDEVLLIIEGHNEGNERVYYEATNLYKLKTEGCKKWVPVEIRLELPKREIKDLKYYIWNKSKEDFQLKNIKTQISLISYQ